MLKKYVTLSNIENAWGDMILGMYNHVKTDNCYEDIYIISYIGFRQVIRAHITCLCFIFPEPKAREIYNSDRLYEPVLPV